MDPKYKADKATGDAPVLDPEKAKKDLEQIEANKKKPRVAGKGAVAPLSRASQFESMSDDELEAHIARTKMQAATGR